MEGRVHLTAGPLLVIASSLLLAAGFRLSEEPAMATVSRAVLAQPMANAAAAARWALGLSDAEEHRSSALRCERRGR
jgi:hypothetical protein